MAAGSSGLDALLRLPGNVPSGGEPSAAIPGGGVSNGVGLGAGSTDRGTPDVPRTAIRQRLARLAAGVDRSRPRRAGARDVQKILNTSGVLVIGFGIAAVVLGWYGAAHSPYLFEEVPYLISGGLLGVALVVAGAAAYAASWSLRQVQEHRRDTETLVAAIERLERATRSAAAFPPVLSPPAPTERPQPAPQSAPQPAPLPEAMVR
jgi:hypothetical protein